MMMLLVSWPVFNLFNWPVSGWDEPIQYMFTIASLTMLIRWLRGAGRRTEIGYVVLASLALVARNTGVLLVPSVLLVALSRARGRSWRQVVGVVCAPVLLWFVWRLAASPGGHALLSSHWGVIRPDSIPRFAHISFNFGDGWLATESISAAIVVLSPYLLLLGLAWSELDRAVRIALVTAVVVNTAVVWLMTLAWESRLFFLPVMLFLPSVGWHARHALVRLCRWDVWRAIVSGWRLVAMLGAVALAFWISAYGYPGMALQNTDLESWPPLVFTAVVWSAHGAARSLDAHPAQRRRHGHQDGPGGDVTLASHGRSASHAGDGNSVQLDLGC